MMTLKGNVKSTAITVICLAFISLFIAGCSTTKNLLGYFKFWDKGREAIRSGLTQEQGLRLPPIRPVLRGNPDSHYLLGQYLQERGKHREAIVELTKTVKIDPHYARAYNALGISYDQLGEFDKATIYYEVALDLSPSGEYFNNLGFNLILKGKYKEAVEVLKTAVGIDPRNEKIRNNLALAHSNAGHHDFALSEIQKTDDPDGNLLALTQALLRTGKTLIASELVKQASSLDPILEQKLSEKDQFVIKMAHLLKEQEELTVTAKEPQKQEVSSSAMQQREKLVRDTRKSSIEVRVAKTRSTRTLKNSPAIFPSDFMLKKKPMEVNMVIEDRKHKVVKATAIPLILQLFPVQYDGCRSFIDNTPHTAWF